MPNTTKARHAAVNLNMTHIKLTTNIIHDFTAVTFSVKLAVFHENSLVLLCIVLFISFFFLFGAHVRAVFLPLSPASTLVYNCFFFILLYFWFFVCFFLSYFVLANKFDLI